MAFDAVLFKNDWNKGATAAQAHYLDRIVVSTQGIAC